MGLIPRQVALPAEVRIIVGDNARGDGDDHALDRETGMVSIAVAACQSARQRATLAESCPVLSILGPMMRWQR